MISMEYYLKLNLTTPIKCHRCHTKFCHNLNIVLLSQRAGIEKLENELLQLQRLHNHFVQKVSSLEKCIFLLKKIGSINDVKNAPVLMVTSATETLETLMA